MGNFSLLFCIRHLTLHRHSGRNHHGFPQNDNKTGFASVFGIDFRSRFISLPSVARLCYHFVTVRFALREKARIPEK